MTIGAARKLAYQVLAKVEHGGAFTNLTLQQAFRQTRVEPRDKGLATEIIYGTLQHRRSLDALVQPFSKRKLSALDPPVLTLLRMTTYQLAFLDKVPSYAAIDDAVELCKQEAPYAAGFVNGVLRALSRAELSFSERLQELAGKASSWADKMGILYSFPTWIVENLCRTYGEERTIKILASSNSRSNLSVRVNRLRASLEDILNSLPEEAQRGVERSQLFPDGLRFTRGFDVESWDAFQDGLVTVQDEAAMVIAPLLQPGQHQVILDMCAAPGTKTTHIAELQGDGGKITATDLHRHKLDLLERAAKRLKLRSIRTLAGDARDLAQTTAGDEVYDAILLDAPCTGLGVLRHRPDIRWKRQPQDLESLQQLQQELLAQAARLLRPGGVLVYSTCTLTQEENEAVVQLAVDDASLGLHWDDIRGDLPEPLRKLVPDNHSGLLITPDLFDTDGFYMARLRKSTG